MKLRPNLRAAAAGVGVLSAVTAAALFTLTGLVGLPLDPGPLLLALLAALALAALAVFLGARSGSFALAWFVAGAAVLWLLSGVGVWQLLRAQAELVSAGKSPAIADAVLWPLLVVSAAAFIGMSIAAGKLIAQPGTRTRA